MNIVAWFKLVGIAVVGLGMGAVLVSQALRRSEIRRRVRSAPQQLADHSVVTLVGTVRALEETLIAPLSGRTCVLHRSTARYPRTAITENDEITVCELVRFTLVTREGDVIVDGDIAEIPDRGLPIVPRKIELEQAFLDRHGVLTSARSMGFDEIVIEPGAKITVHGVARVEITPDAGREAGFREAQTMVRLVGDAQHPLTIMRS